jgi:threonine/homoserine/homoserine lactone efflux protein
MQWTTYATYLTFASVVVLVPGPDFAVVTGNAVAGGRRRGLWCAAGVASSNAAQGTAAVVGLGAIVVNAQPVFQLIKWVGAGYLAYLGVRLLRSALLGRYPSISASADEQAALRGWRQGFLSNITNPKVLIFYLAVLPQFLTPNASALALLLFALSHAALSLIYLVTLTVVLHGARRLVNRTPIRRTLDAVTGTAMVGFSARLALDRP